MEVGASIVSLLSVGATIAIAINDLVTSCKNAPLFAQSVLHETLEFGYALSKLQRLVQGPQATSLDQSRTSMIDVNHLSLTLVGCVCTFSQLEKEIQRMKLSGKFGIMDRVKWSLIERDVGSIVQRIQNHKMSLVLILTILNGSPIEATNSRASLDMHLSTTMSNTPSSILDDDDAASVTSNSSSARKLYQHSFESALFLSRPYVRGRRFEDDQSALSFATSQRPKGSWSLYTAKSSHSVFSLPVSVTAISGTSLADIPSICNLSLPVPPGVLDNSGVYDPHNTNPLKPTYTPSSMPIGPDKLSPTVDSNYYSVSFRPLLLKAAAKGLDVVVKSLLDQAAIRSINYIEETQPHLDDALSEAVVNGQTQVIHILLERGARWSLRSVDPLTESSLLEPLQGRGASPVIEAQDSSGFTPLDVAINNGTRRDVITFLLNGDEATQGADRDGFTLLHAAVRYMRSESSIEHILDQGAAVKARTIGGYTALHLAVKIAYPMTRTIRLLLARGADIEAETDTHDKPLHLAITSSNIEIVELLLDEGAAIEARGTGGYTPLHLAVNAVHPSKRIVKLLLARGANIEAETDAHDRPLQLAVKDGNIQVVKLLLDEGAAIRASTRDGYTALHLAARFLYPTAKTIKLLLARGADIEAETDTHDTPLHLAVKASNIHTVELLLDEGAAIEASTRDGYTPLHLAVNAVHPSKRILKLLLARGANIEAEIGAHDRPLHLAVKAGNIQVVKLLLDEGAAIEASTRDGYTPLHLAVNAVHPSKRIIKLLLARGADIEAETDTHHKALHLAVVSSNTKIVELLLDEGAAFGREGLVDIHPYIRQ